MIVLQVMQVMDVLEAQETKQTATKSVRSPGSLCFLLGNRWLRFRNCAGTCVPPKLQRIKSYRADLARLTSRVVATCPLESRKHLYGCSANHFPGKCETGRRSTGFHR